MKNMTSRVSEPAAENTTIFVLTKDVKLTAHSCGFEPPLMRPTTNKSKAMTKRTKKANYPRPSKQALTTAGQPFWTHPQVTKSAEK